MSSGTGNVRGGKNYKKKKTNRVRPQRKDIELDVEGGDGYFGIVKKIMGGTTIEVNLSDGTVSQAKIPGKMRNKIWIKPGNKVLLTRDKEVVKIIRENDKESRDVTQMMQKSSHDDIFNQGDDNIEMDDSAGNVNRPSKLTLKNRDVKRMHARDTESFTDPTILQRQAETITLGTDSESEDDAGTDGNTAKADKKKDSYGNDLDDLDDVIEKMEKKKTSHITNEKTQETTKPMTESDSSGDSSVEIDDI